MPVTQDQKDALAGNVTWCCHVWRVTAKDGTVFAAAAHTRNLVLDGVTYYAGPFNPKQTESQIGLDVDDSEITGPIDDVITEADIYAKKWEGARIYKAIVVDYRDPSLGVVAERNGFVGQITVSGGVFTFEFQSLSQALNMEMGDLTSAVDRNRKPEDLGISIGSWTHALTVTAVTDRRVFTVDWPAAPDGYFMYGRAAWTSGANSGLQMEIENNTAGEVALAMPMRSQIQAGDTVTMVAGYNGTREAARDKFGAAINMDAEPDLPGLAAVLTYPE